MDKKQHWAKRGMIALMAAAFLSTAPGIVLADQLAGEPEAGEEAKGIVPQDLVKEAVSEQDPGKQAFNQYCASCHGTDAKGNGPVADTLKKEPADLTQITKKNGGEFDTGAVARMIDGQADVAGHGPQRSQSRRWYQRQSHARQQTNHA